MKIQALVKCGQHKPEYYAVVTLVQYRDKYMWRVEPKLWESVYSLEEFTKRLLREEFQHLNWLSDRLYLKDYIGNNVRILGDQHQMACLEFYKEDLENLLTSDP